MNKQPKREFDWGVVGGIAIMAIILYLIIGVVFAWSGPVFGIFAKHSHPIRGLLDIISIVSFFPLIGFVFMLVTGQLDGPFFSKNIKIEILLFAVMIIGSINMPFALGVGSTQIGSFFEKTVYTEDYYVEVDGKQYPAQIFRSHNDSGIVYILERIYFKDETAYFTFSESLEFMWESDIDYVFPDITTVVTTDEGRSVSVKLTTVKVE